MDPNQVSACGPGWPFGVVPFFRPIKNCCSSAILRPTETIQRDILVGAITELLWKVIIREAEMLKMPKKTITLSRLHCMPYLNLNLNMFYLDIIVAKGVKISTNHFFPKKN